MGVDKSPAPLLVSLIAMVKKDNTQGLLSYLLLHVGD